MIITRGENNRNITNNTNIANKFFQEHQRHQDIGTLTEELMSERNSQRNTSINTQRKNMNEQN